MAKTLVTGGCGFIGSHLVDLLLKRGHEVIVVDNFQTGNLKNLDSHLNNKNLRIINSEILEIEKIKASFRNCEYVFHLAAIAEIVPSIDNPVEYFNTNVMGTIKMLELARELPLKKFIYAASSSCYGIPTKYPTDENEIVQTNYPYAFTKWAGEQAAFHWSKVYGLPVISLRLFNVYGTRSRTSGTYGAVFGVFLAQKLAKIPLTIVGDGTQSRDFINVKDVANAFFETAFSEYENEIFNVGSGTTTSINKLVQIIDSPSTHLPKRPGEPDITHADISKIQNLIGWSPVIEFEDGVKEMLENISYWKSAPIWDVDSIKVATHNWFKYLDNSHD